MTSLANSGSCATRRWARRGAGLQFLFGISSPWHPPRSRRRLGPFHQRRRPAPEALEQSQQLLGLQVLSPRVPLKHVRGIHYRAVWKRHSLLLGMCHRLRVEALPSGALTFQMRVQARGHQQVAAGVSAPALLPEMVIDCRSWKPLAATTQPSHHCRRLHASGLRILSACGTRVPVFSGVGEVEDAGEESWEWGIQGVSRDFQPNGPGRHQLQPNFVWPAPTLAKTLTKFGQTKFGQNKNWIFKLGTALHNNTQHTTQGTVPKKKAPKGET